MSEKIDRKNLLEAVPSDFEIPIRAKQRLELQTLS